MALCYADEPAPRLEGFKDYDVFKNAAEETVGKLSAEPKCELEDWHLTLDAHDACDLTGVAKGIEPYRHLITGITVSGPVDLTGIELEAFDNLTELDLAGWTKAAGAEIDFSALSELSDLSLSTKHGPLIATVPERCSISMQSPALESSRHLNSPQDSREQFLQSYEKLHEAQLQAGERLNSRVGVQEKALT